MAYKQLALRADGNPGTKIPDLCASEKRTKQIQYSHGSRCRQKYHHPRIDWRRFD